MSAKGKNLLWIEAPVLTDTPPQMAAAIHITVARSEIRSVMGPGLAEIIKAVKAQSIGPTGPWFTHQFEADPTAYDLDICVPVSAAVKSVGRVEKREIPGLKVVQTVYQGDYERLAEAWAEFHEWIHANGHAVATDFYERYVVGPESVPHPEGWRTELRRPLLAKLP
jgi:effector-binding domain-containing protein